MRASVMVDSPYELTEGAYAGLSGVWRTRDAGMAYSDTQLGWSGRLNAFDALKALDAGWGWDLGVHRMHYGGGTTRKDFHEWMVGLLAPTWSARMWYAKNYFVGTGWSLYAELNGSIALDANWRLFAHLGTEHYGRPTGPDARIAASSDAMVGVSYVIDDWQFRVARDGLIHGDAPAVMADRARHPAWASTVSVAF